MELIIACMVLLHMQHETICLHRSHFGSRYKTGCCGHAGLLIFWPRFDPRRKLKRGDVTQRPGHSAAFRISCGRACPTIADVHLAARHGRFRQVAAGHSGPRHVSACAVGRDVPQRAQERTRTSPRIDSGTPGRPARAGRSHVHARIGGGGGATRRCTAACTANLRCPLRALRPAKRRPRSARGRGA